MKNLIQEIQEGILTENQVNRLLDRNNTVLLKGRNRDIAIGTGFLIKVCTNIGVSDPNELQFELNKLRLLNNVKFAPDIVMDHTIVNLKKPLWETMVDEFSGAVGTLPHYLTYNPQKGIDEVELLEMVSKMAEYGVSFITIHPTANRNLLSIAKRERVLPTTARGGSIVLKDLEINRRKENVFEKNYLAILKILKSHDMAVSIGTTFRPSNVFEAMDMAHLEETKLQAEFVRVAKENGVNVLMEGVGHIRLNDMEKYAGIIKRIDVPFMPLGPMPTDASVGFDHVASAIGASHLGYMGVAKIFHSITREEHTGNVPSVDSIIEGLKSARIAAHTVNISLFPNYATMDKQVALTRAHNKTCVINQGLFADNIGESYNAGCNRCKHECPLMLNL
ncbi:MAG: phosphomethylpyrimidine synthase ThiC [Bacteroidales bacterium]|nr:phosphomethylpyrimidine synthase ThiC [Bacteroidales bacterium]